MTSPATQNDRDVTLAALARLHPGWQVWKAVSGRYHGQLYRDPSVKAEGEDPTDLHDMIVRAEYYIAAGLRPPAG